MAGVMVIVGVWSDGAGDGRGGVDGASVGSWRSLR